MNIEIIFADKDLVALNKPPGISVHGGPTVSGKTVVDFLLEKFPEMKGVGDPPALPPAAGMAQAGDPLRPGIVHRLDKDTSGVMVAARNQETFLALKNIFQKRLAEKKYVAVACGKFREKRGVIDFPIGRLKANPLKRGVNILEKKRSVRGEREAITHYTVLKEGEKFSLVELIPKTGRMHQLRVHCAAIHHPIACDKVYGGKKVCCPEGAGRQLLHARSLSFVYPEGRKLHFEADFPEDFALAAERLL